MRLKLLRLFDPVLRVLFPRHYIMRDLELSERCSAARVMRAIAHNGWRMKTNADGDVIITGPNICAMDEHTYRCVAIYRRQIVEIIEKRDARQKTLDALRTGESGE